MKKDKLFMIISISLLVICIIGSTYALYKGILSKNLEVNTTTHGLDYYINYVKGNDINSSTLNPSTDYTGGSSSDIEFWKKDDTYDIYGKIELTVNTIGTNLSNSSALKYSVVNNGEVLSTGSLKGTTAGSKVTILEALYLETTRQIYTVYIWLDNNEELGDISNESLSISVDCTASMILTMTQKIINLYTNASKSTVTNNSIEYNYATSVNLMNDRLGGTTADYDAGNIRYYGADPNNYIYFNCSDYANQSSDTCELWRIIGVFDDKVKIIRNESIGNFAWDNKPSGTGSSTSSNGSNDWTDARLMMLLNPGYETTSSVYSYEGSLYWNSKSGTCYSGYGNATKSCDFTSTGLKNDTTRNMIEEVTWNLGGWNSSSVYSNQIYSYERGTTVYSGRPTNWTGKIGLMYPSDYGYATDFTKCSQNLDNYDSSTDSYACRTNDWLYNDVYQWLLTPTSSYSITAWRMWPVGSVFYGEDVFRAYGVRPVLYLASELSLSGGVGSSADPYRLSSS